MSSEKLAEIHNSALNWQWMPCQSKNKNLNVIFFVLFSIKLTVVWNNNKKKHFTDCCWLLYLSPLIINLTPMNFHWCCSFCNRYWTDFVAKLSELICMLSDPIEFDISTIHIYATTSLDVFLPHHLDIPNFHIVQMV